MTSEISSLASVAGAPATTSTDNTAPNELGKDAFLQLLIAQIENQNPLDPSDPSEFLGQLASFTSLEQMGEISDGIESLGVLQATGLSLENVNLVGKTVVYESPTSAVDDAGEARFRYNMTQPAQRVVVEYRDGGVTKTKEISNVQTGNQDLVLEDLDGTSVEIVSIKAYQGDEALDTSIRTYAVSKVDGVTFEGGAARLMAGPIVRIDPSQVVEILGD